jgi:hypothetical protein
VGRLHSEQLIGTAACVKHVRCAGDCSQHSDANISRPNAAVPDYLPPIFVHDCGRAKVSVNGGEACLLLLPWSVSITCHSWRGDSVVVSADLYDVQTTRVAVLSTPCTLPNPLENAHIACCMSQHQFTLCDAVCSSKHRLRRRHPQDPNRVCISGQAGRPRRRPSWAWISPPPWPPAPHSSWHPPRPWLPVCQRC